MNFMVIDEDHQSQLIVGARDLEELIGKVAEERGHGYDSHHGEAIGHLRVWIHYFNGEAQSFDVIVLDTVCSRPHTAQAPCGDTPPSHRGVVPQEILEGGYNPPPPGGVRPPEKVPAAPPPKRKTCPKCGFTWSDRAPRDKGSED